MQGNESHLSIYDGNLTDTNIAVCLKKLQVSFPRQSATFFDVLTERIIANGFTDERLKDAVNYVIDNFAYKALNISDIIRFDKTIRLYTYNEVTAAVTRNELSFNDTIRRKIGDRVYWIKKADAEKFGHETHFATKMK